MLISEHSSNSQVILTRLNDRICMFDRPLAPSKSKMMLQDWFDISLILKGRVHRAAVLLFLLHVCD